ncbi:Rpn family recombination-promoting nuclease/putative transposase [Pseudanabaena sp. UWO310]|uniref:Rpn family recombination-promoting nuclease/putative transposase n=1 Tax=Pseudanabaena sp. UWO310 TaxID=2480795 RepID=UPI0011610915|nr:Rpn family recombination-promoting nuclease/putative transposase [Pseudanabaena sp. UWO310]TYQ23746.1 Rpn family recombination-promoting nuclease/putative transposase [Pseudanabaena sp. UWO310]
MKTDTLFYQLFNTFHTLLFELIERPIAEAEGYEFSSVEVKEKAFRFDGIFSPKAKDKPIYLIEVQFQQKEDFYWEYLSEIYLYLNQYRPEREWQAIAIFARRSYEPEPRSHVREMLDCQRIRRVYLEDLLERETDSFAIGIIQLILSSESQAVRLARQLGEKIEQENNTEIQEQVLELIETVLVYKFPKLSRQEIEAMFTYSDLKQTRVYQEAREEGEQRGLKLGEQRGLVKGQSTMLLRMLGRKFGQITPSLRGKVNKLSAKQLENLAEALFDLETIADLNNWLKTKGKGN